MLKNESTSEPFFTRSSHFFNSKYKTKVVQLNNLAFFFWEKIASEISVCNIHLVGLIGDWWTFSIGGNPM